MSFYQQNTISLYSWFFVSLVLQYIFQWHFIDPFPEHWIGANYDLVSKETGWWVAQPWRVVWPNSVLLIGWGSKFHQHHDRINDYGMIRDDDPANDFDVFVQTPYIPGNVYCISRPTSVSE